MKIILVLFVSLLAACGGVRPVSEPIVINPVSVPVEQLASIRKGAGNKKNISPCLSYVYTLDSEEVYMPSTSSRDKCIDEYKITAGEYVLTIYCGDRRNLRAYPRVKVSLDRGKEYLVNCLATYKHSVGGVGVGFPRVEAVLVPVDS